MTPDEFLYIGAIASNILIGFTFSLPITYGMAREFWGRHAETSIPYDALFGRLHLVVIIACGPLVGLLMLLCGQGKGVGFHYRFPSRTDWDRFTTPHQCTILTGVDTVGLTTGEKAHT